MYQENTSLQVSLKDKIFCIATGGKIVDENTQYEGAGIGRSSEVGAYLRRFSSFQFDSYSSDLIGKNVESSNHHNFLGPILLNPKL